MRSLITAIGVTFVCGAFALVGIGQEGSLTPGAVDRVQLFDRLAGPRIDVTEDAQGVAPLRQFCLERTSIRRRRPATNLSALPAPAAGPSMRTCSDWTWTWR